MTTVQRKMIDDLRTALGQQADPEAIIQRLYDYGVLDDVLSRRYVVRREFMLRYSTTCETARSIHFELADEYGLSRQGVSLIVSGK